MEWTTPQFWIAAGQIIVIDLLLSGDNAVVIGLACRNLPPAQRRLGIFWGVFGAIVLRVALTAFAAVLMGLPYLKLVGAVLLGWIGIKLIAEGDHDAPTVKVHDRLMSAIYTVIVADAVMSLDNVIAVAGAARGDLVLLIFGLALSIPIMVAGSQIVLRLITRFPLLVLGGGGLLGYIAGELAVTDPVVAPHLASFQPQVHFVVPAAGFLIVVTLAAFLARRRRGAKV